MAISEKNAKILWGRAAGRCSKPDCRVELTYLLNNQNPYHLGEMAHVIARGKTGPRANGSQSNDTYSNLILLCPTHHKQIDKAPEQFPESLLNEWKSEHETWINQSLSQHKCVNIEELESIVCELLSENKYIWVTYGPESNEARLNPGSNLFKLWHMKRLDSVIPNNKKIINLITTNKKMLNKSQKEAFIAFRNHSEAYEINIMGRIENYPRFPRNFAKEFACE